MIAAGLGLEAALATWAGAAGRRHPIAKLRRRTDEMPVLGAPALFLPDALDQKSHAAAPRCAADVVAKSAEGQPFAAGLVAAVAVFYARRMSELAVTISPETPADAEAVERLHERTFGPG